VTEPSEARLHHLDIALLGAFEVRVGGRPVPDPVWRRKKPAALVKLLALAPGYRLHREQILDTLWPDLAPDAAGANLRKAVHQVRRAFDEIEAGAGGLLSSDGDMVSLASAQVAVDLEAFRSGLASARRAGRTDLYLGAIEAYREGLLPEDRYDDWAAETRRELHLDVLAGMTELVGLFEANGELERAIGMSRQAVAVEPLHEESQATLMRLYALAGRRAEALGQYEHLTRLLEEELGTGPSPDTQRLYEEIRARQEHEPELTADLWERVGELRMVSGDASGAAKAFRLALEAGGKEATTARLQRRCAEAFLLQHRPEAAGAHLAAAASALESDAGDRAEESRLLRARANHAWEVGDIEAARDFAERSLDGAQRHGTPDDLAAALEAVAIVSHFQGEWRQGMESDLERLADEEAGRGQLVRVFDIHHCIAQYHLYGDDTASVEGYARRILDRAEDIAAVRAQAFAWCLLGESLLLQARWDEALGCLERSCDIHASLGRRSGALPWQRRAEIAVCRSAFDEAAACLREATAIATVTPRASHMWSRIYATAALAALEQGHPERAVASIRAAAAASVRYGDCRSCSALLNPVAAETFALLGDPESAGGYAESAAQIGETFNSPAWRAMAQSAAGSVAAANGDHQAALGHFDLARQLYERAGQPYWAQRSRRLAST
jgi:DNA-binding SARP family transcriptional activator